MSRFQMILSDPVILVGGFIYFSLPLLFYFVVTRNDFGVAFTYEKLFHALRLGFLRTVLCAFTNAFSFNKSRKKREPAVYIRESKELERRIQRYEYFAEISSALKQEASMRQLKESQKALLTEAPTELQTLPWLVYKGVRFLVNYEHENVGNGWLRLWIYGAEERHEKGRQCARQLGCCADACGCCSKPRRKSVQVSQHQNRPSQKRRKRKFTDLSGNLPDGKQDPISDDAPSADYMRLARARYLRYAHCSVDYGCCIRRRGFRILECDGVAQSVACVKREQWMLRSIEI